MNTVELQTIWSSSGNQITSATQQQTLERFWTRLNRDRRRHYIWLVWTAFQLTIITGFAAWLLLGTTKVNLSREWTVVPLLLLPWAVFFLLLRMFRKDRTAPPAVHSSVRDAITAGMQANSAAIRRSKVLGAMYALALPILTGAAWQLQHVGKMTPHQMVCMVGLLAGALCIAAIIVGIRYYRYLLPQERQFRNLEQQWAASPAEK